MTIAKSPGWDFERFDFFCIVVCIVVIYRAKIDICDVFRKPKMRNKALINSPPLRMTLVQWMFRIFVDKILMM